MLALIAAITAAYPSLYGAPAAGCYSEYVTPRRPVDASTMTIMGDALAGLPNGAAWQGVATDGAYWFMLTSEAPGSTRNQIRKYLISTGELVSSNLDAYSDQYRFSSGEIIDGLLYVSVRGPGSSWSHIVASDPSDLRPARWCAPIPAASKSGASRCAISCMSRSSASVGFSPTRWKGARKMPNVIRPGL